MKHKIKLLLIANFLYCTVDPSTFQLKDDYFNGQAINPNEESNLKAHIKEFMQKASVEQITALSGKNLSRFLIATDEYIRNTLFENNIAEFKKLIDATKNESWFETDKAINNQILPKRLISKYSENKDMSWNERKQILEILVNMIKDLKTPDAKTGCVRALFLTGGFDIQEIKGEGVRILEQLAINDLEIANRVISVSACGIFAVGSQLRNDPKYPQLVKQIMERTTLHHPEQSNTLKEIVTLILTRGGHLEGTKLNPAKHATINGLIKGNDFVKDMWAKIKPEGNADDSKPDTDTADRKTGTPDRKTDIADSKKQDEKQKGGGLKWLLIVGGIVILLGVIALVAFQFFGKNKTGEPTRPHAVK